MVSVDLRDQSQVANARRRAVRMAEVTGLDEHAIARLALVATEAATNTLRHGGGGEMLIGADPVAGEPAVDLLAFDRGPGMENVQACLADGFSTAGSAGNGFGAIARMSDHVDIYAPPGFGTIVHARFLPGRHPRGGSVEAKPAGRTIGAICVPKAGEVMAGDIWAVRRFSDSWSLMVCDGLGHGAGAAKAAAAAHQAFIGPAGESPAEAVEILHAALRQTRGAVVGIASFRPADRIVRYAGVGNISAWLRWDGGEQRPVSIDGIVGHNLTRVREADYPYEGRLTGIFHSDGLSGRWNLDSYPGLATREPMLIAAVLYRDFRRPRDDSAVVVVKTG